MYRTLVVLIWMNARVPILQVGISGFRLPLSYVGPDGENLTIETHVTGTVSLDADKKGINMSRIIRIFYEYKKELFRPSFSQLF